MDISKRLGTIEMQFGLAADLMSALQSSEAHAGVHKSFALVLDQSPLLNSMDAVKDVAEQYPRESPTLSKKRRQHQGQQRTAWFCVSIASFGNGMEPEQLSSLLQASSNAYNATDASTRNVASARLSLFLSVELWCRRHGGFLSCASTPYDSTVFHIGLPVTLLSTHDAQARMDSTALSTNVLQGHAVGKPIVVSGPILVVGDTANADIQNHLWSHCHHFRVDAQIFHASNVAEAVAAFGETPTPSVVLVNHGSSGVGLDGLEVIAKIRKMEFEQHLQPSYIVTCTADILDNASMILLQAGGNQVVLKPLVPDVLRNLVRRFHVETETAPAVLQEFFQSTRYY